MSDLTEFLLARVAEDEATADLAEQVGHISGQGYVRVLAECEAKRAIVEEARRWIERASGPETSMPERALAFLAAVYADHPDYRPEWRP